MWSRIVLVLISKHMTVALAGYGMYMRAQMPQSHGRLSWLCGIFQEEIFKIVAVYMIDILMYLRFYCWRNSFENRLKTISAIRNGQKKKKGIWLAQFSLCMYGERNKNISVAV